MWGISVIESGENPVILSNTRDVHESGVFSQVKDQIRMTICALSCGTQGTVGSADRLAVTLHDGHVL
jgi:hypothetical protein